VADVSSVIIFGKLYPGRFIRFVGRLTRSLPLSRPDGLPVYVARIPAAPFCETPWSASDTDALQLALRWMVFTLVKESDNDQPVL
jgi:hypothetical protein